LVSSSKFRFSAKRLQRIRDRVREISFFDVEGGWQKSPVSPMEVAKLFKRIRVKDGFELIAYVFRSSVGGNGIVWAVPEGYFPDVSECERLGDLMRTPKPRCAISPHHVVEVDGSPGSYIQKSIFIREIEEFGAFWHGLSWSLHEIIDSKPKGFKWYEDVEDLSPKVVMGEKVTVEFFTLSEFIGEAVYRHEDVYEGEMLESSRRVIASGGMGYVL
jgi:hypothetical protein